MRNQSKRMKRIQAAAAGTLTLSMVMGAASPALAAEMSAGSAGYSTSYSTSQSSGGTVTAVRESQGPASAEEAADITREEAEKRMKELFPVLRKAKLDQIRFGGNSYPPASENIWNLNWSVTSEDGRSTHGFSSEMDAMTGDVLSMFIPESALGEPTYYPPKLNREEARKAAEAIVEKAVPSLKGSVLKVKDDNAASGALFGPFQYSFTFDTEHNGIAVPFRSVHVTIDGDGNVIRLSYRPLAGSMPEAAEPIPKEQALSAYQAHLDLQLAYVNINRFGETPKWALAWMPSPSYTGVMDAASGEWLSFDGRPIAAEQAAVRYETIAPSGQAAFQPEQPQGETITQERAAEIVSSVFRLPDDHMLEQHTLQDDYAAGRLVWRLVWRQQGNAPIGPSPMIMASVDAKTGQIYEIRKDLFLPLAAQTKPEESAGQAVSEAEAKRKADDLIAKLFPDAANALKRIEGTPPGVPANASSDGYLFGYQPFRNGYPVQDYNIRLQLSKDGQLTSYSSIGSAPMPDASGLPKEASVSKADAERQWLERSDLLLQYERFGGYYVDNGEQVEETVRLTYRHQWKADETAVILDAVTGEWLVRGYAAPIAVGAPLEPKDIRGHAAEEDLRTLAQFRVLETDGEGLANPDALITRTQWAGWLAKAVDPYFVLGAGGGPRGAEQAPYYADVPVDGELHKALRILAQMRWIETGEKGTSSFGPEEAVSREELAVWAVRVLRYDRLAELLREDPEIAAAGDYEQIAHPGAAALAVKLKLLPLQDGRWDPDRKITRAEAASFLMEIVRLQASVDQPVQSRYY